MYKVIVTHVLGEHSFAASFSVSHPINYGIRCHVSFQPNSLSNGIFVIVEVM